MTRGHEADELIDLALMEERAARSGSRFAYILSLLTVAALVTFFVWADRAVLEEVTRGTATVIPSSRTQVIQNLEGGIIDGLHVSEGDIVSPGDLLVTIRNEIAQSAFANAYTRYYSLLASTARLEAEVSGKEAPTFPKEVIAEAPEMVAQELRLFNARQDQLNAGLQVLQTAADSVDREIIELKARHDAVTATLSPARRELSMLRPLASRGIVSQVDVLRLEKEVASLSGEATTVERSIERAESNAKEARERVVEAVLGFRSDALAQLNEQRVDLKSIASQINAEQDRVQRTEVRAPVRGTIKQLYKTTLGGVVRPGETIMEIVPLDDTLLVEAEITPKDIAFLHPEQNAAVKMTAYDFSVYGGLVGTVERISADTIVDQEGRSFFKVYVRTNKNYLEKDGEVLPIIPGMTAQVDILTGRKSVLEYLSNPIVNWREDALRER
ncbi:MULTISPECIES: HlyD family type I secretion periplasmic adaptor subunit [Limibacillus]|jgi:adhesin transport system membrane fusion protein|uniref:Membrane fusion protein (MFP) family protein n=1 Tax=Limibacillus halophilus TaxID=1579333 RepID=A0A839SWU7_9PROT|nr:HlyD family type I secretion periplasmic adaptor subunit [Limibacillus halophilus]MBB3065435.1 adhesin transport system membrane fusion protein [Limibacillus halophilus]